MTSFGFESNALDVVEGIDLTGKRAIVTGGAANVLFAVGATARWAADGITANAERLWDLSERVLGAHVR